jgi:integrase
MPEAIEILKEVLADRSLGPLDFVFRLGTADALSTRVGRIISRAGLVDLTFHDLRHEATSRLSLRYRNPSDLKRVTGHKDLKSLDRYYHPDLKTLAEQDDRLAA